MGLSAHPPATVPAIDANGARIPRMGLGTWRSTHDEGVCAVRAALEAGYRHIDTAARYENEQAVGQALAASALPRDEVFVTTKVWHTELRANDFRRAAQASVARLGLDHVDLLLVHWPNPEVPLEETIGALCDAQRSGLTRHIGVSNFPVALLERAVALASVPLVANQCEYHPYLDQTRLLAACSRHGMALISHSPLGSGKLLADPVIADIAQRHERKPAQIILRWLMQQPGVAAIPKSSNPVRIGENLAVFDFELDALSMARISALARADGRVSKPAWHPEWDTPANPLVAAKP
ncbi:aldo/keto reductase [Paraburkholderia lacunae]|uniref:2,5-didehydrogluconate reductase n=1 Tax=Paraburkholderia lacunae TaxID=2211104 RepID=A0A370NB24_9BURK|nr:aldo/keto reductase [Paraburkholderia lacunae]RDK02802.1 2,5-didehydrogluconate reductase [Paraburkholderia lacunae]